MVSARHLRKIFFPPYTIMSKRVEESKDNRERILLAAERLFAAQGFSATSVREIVGQADVTAPVLYYYFGSKEELLHTLISERFASHLERLHVAMQHVQSPDDVVSQWYRATMAVTKEHPMALRLVLGALWGPDIQSLDALVHELFYNCRSLFCECIQRVDPSIERDRAQYSYLVLSGMLNTFLFPLLRMGLSFDVEEIIASLTPRVVTILRDDAPLPSATLHKFDSHIRKLISESSEIETEETS